LMGRQIYSEMLSDMENRASITRRAVQPKDNL